MSDTEQTHPPTPPPLFSSSSSSRVVTDSWNRSCALPPKKPSSEAHLLR